MDNLKAISPYQFNDQQYQAIMAKLQVQPIAGETPPTFPLPFSGEIVVSKLTQIPELGALIVALSSGLTQEIQNRIAEIERLENLIKEGGGTVDPIPDYQEQINGLFQEIGKLSEKIETLNENLKAIDLLEDSIKEIKEKMENVLIMPPQLPEHETGVFGLYVEDGQWKLWRVTPYD